MNRTKSFLNCISALRSLRAFAALLGLVCMLAGLFGSTASVLVQAARINADQASALAWVSSEELGTKKFDPSVPPSDDSSESEDEDLSFADEALIPAIRSVAFLFYATDDTKLALDSLRYSFELKRDVHRPPEAHSV